MDINEFNADLWSSVIEVMDIEDACRFLRVSLLANRLAISRVYRAFRVSSPTQLQCLNQFFKRESTSRLLGGSDMKDAVVSVCLGVADSFVVDEALYQDLDYTSLLPLLATFRNVQSCRVHQINFPLAMVVDIVAFWPRLKEVSLINIVDCVVPAGISFPSDCPCILPAIERVTVSGNVDTMGGERWLDILAYLLAQQRVCILGMDWVSLSRLEPLLVSWGQLLVHARYLVVLPPVSPNVLGITVGSVFQENGVRRYMPNLTKFRSYQGSAHFDVEDGVLVLRLASDIGGVTEFDIQRFVVSGDKIRSQLKLLQIWKMYKDAESSFWTAESIDVSTDGYHWRHCLADDERNFLAGVIAVFALSHGGFSQTIVQRMLAEVQLAEARCFYGFQNMVGNIHSETYYRLIDTYLQDEKQRETLLYSVENMTAFRKMGEWATRWSDVHGSSFAESLVALAVAQAVLFSGCFVCAASLEQRGVMPGFTRATGLVTEDRALQMNFAILLLTMIRSCPPAERIKQMVDDAVGMETSLVESEFSASPCPPFQSFFLSISPWSLPFPTGIMPANLNGVLRTSVVQYIQFVGDRPLTCLGCEPLYNAQNPFNFLEGLGLQATSKCPNVRDPKQHSQGFGSQGGAGHRYFVRDKTHQTNISSTPSGFLAWSWMISSKMKWGPFKRRVLFRSIRIRCGGRDRMEMSHTRMRLKSYEGTIRFQVVALCIEGQWKTANY
ncbi:Ribonucleoside-diphosphate reductase subunit M2 [Marasmius tenuissimus]|uniref:Ribonucleoside-diphosphate reductase subunit M2 n=1 Tax=Marasmius tenuissimus TaxID=585030 RepID=A0ABR2ZK79_9AGAR